MEFEVVEPSSPEAQAAVARYFAELGARFEAGFDADAYGRASAATGDGLFVIGRRAGEVVVCGAVLPLAPAVAEIKRMWVDPGVRGGGLGRALLGELERRAAGRGWTTVRLDTNASLTEAIALYERCGYRRIPRYNANPYAHVWFEKILGTDSRHPRTDV